MTFSVVDIQDINPVAHIRRLGLFLTPAVFKDNLIANGFVDGFSGVACRFRLAVPDGSRVILDVTVTPAALVAHDYQLVPALCAEINKVWAEYRGITVQCLDLDGEGESREYIVTVTVNLSEASKGFSVPDEFIDVFPFIKIAGSETPAISDYVIGGETWEKVVMDGVVGEAYLGAIVNNVKPARVDGVVQGLKTFLPSFDTRAMSHPGL